MSLLFGSAAAKSMNRGKLFYRLVQQAMAIEPVPMDRIVHPEEKPARKLLPRKTPAKVEEMNLVTEQASGTHGHI